MRPACALLRQARNRGRWRNAERFRVKPPTHPPCPYHLVMAVPGPDRGITRPSTHRRRLVARQIIRGSDPRGGMTGNGKLGQRRARRPASRGGAVTRGGAKGSRTPDLLNAIRNSAFLPLLRCAISTGRNDGKVIISAGWYQCMPPRADTGHRHSTRPPRTPTYQSYRSTVGSQWPGTRRSFSPSFGAVVSGGDLQLAVLVRGADVTNVRTLPDQRQAGVHGHRLVPGIEHRDVLRLARSSPSPARTARAGRCRPARPPGPGYARSPHP